MRTKNISRLIMVISILVFLVTGCEDKEKKPLNKIAETPGVYTKPLRVKTVNESLRKLYLDAAAVDTLNGRLVFRFYVDGENDMVIRGWKDNFDKTPPIVDLKPAGLGNAKILNDTYLGNILLNANTLQEIKRKVGTGPGKFAFLMFDPVVDTRAGSVGQIVYRLVYTNRPPFFRTAMMGGDSLLNQYDSILSPPQPTDEYSGFMLNPSPPRKESDQ